MFNKDICFIAKYRRFIERNEATNIGVIVFDNIEQKWYTKYVDEIDVEDKSSFSAWKNEWQLSVIDNCKRYPTVDGLIHSACAHDTHFFLESCPDNFVRKTRYLTDVSHNDFTGVLYKSLVEPIRSVFNSNVDVLACGSVDGKDIDC